MTSNREQAVIVIPRKVGESVVIGDGIVVTVVEIQGDNVRVQIDYPTEEPVHRREAIETVEQAEAVSPRPR